MTAKPEDHKSKTYTFTHNDKSFTIPSFASLPTGVIRKARKGTDEMDKVFLIIETVMGEESPEMAALDAMSSDEFNEFLLGWTQGAGVGEA